jgi:SAM-dependent methyltransferase
LKAHVGASAEVAGGPDSTLPGAQPAHFDGFAGRYQEVLDANLAITGETGVVFTELRMAYLRRRLPLLPSRVLDFGCGIGLAIPFLLAAFPGCQVVGVDVSPESVRVASSRCRDERVSFSLPSELDAGAFDLVYTSGVIHHIPRDERPDAVRVIWNALRPGGTVAIAEHNPWNPATRYLVRTCPFDEDAQLLRPAETRRLFELAGFELVATDFVSFFPGALRPLRRIEHKLHRLPIGAQYITLARRPI